MIVYVDLEHGRLRQDAALWRLFASKTLETKYRLEAIAGAPCLIVRYDRITPALLRGLSVQAVVVGGHYTGLQHYDEKDLAGLRAIFREAAWPTLSICGGFQLMAQTYGADIDSMAVTAQPLKLGDNPAASRNGFRLQLAGTPVPPQVRAVVPGERVVEQLPMADDFESLPETPLPPEADEIDPDAAGLQARRERGFMPVHILQPHPLFEGLGRRPVVFELHSWEVKSAPDGFRILAESDLCRLQAVAHQSAPLFGTQFHPESYDDAHPDGRMILENFFRMAGIIT